ncbi:uncharacterized protein PHACADRAFT_30574 [Phanerochaete carnosa HHB-10118-sp]|uniref:Uncharacterized protein n=1 Tax=Phanerochaete carnosa (strain HHB-10118-sp) TaxID=650164 RepID=K5WT45_PHACS|nr:uncharacterized protein PHACADRAFT_30574 [Phanerochaete carnosa HHB-10118-sp]EKM53607.1 hypothetical protein PHACADRAFT_30574 [Phanerochaete carnosa HHB-10118-sp]
MFSPPRDPQADGTAAGGHLASRPASSESWSASAESTDQSSDNESVAHSQFGADGEDGGSHTLSADGDAPESPPLSRRHGGGRRTPPELTLPDSSDSPLRSFRARPPGHRKRPSHVHVLTRMMPTKDGRAATPASPAALRLQADEASSPVSPGTDWKNFVQQFRSARTSLGPTDAIFAALSSPPKRPARTAHSRTSSDTTTYDDQEDSDSSVDEDREREETLRKAEEYFFAGRLSHEGHQSDIM